MRKIFWFVMMVALTAICICPVFCQDQGSDEREPNDSKEQADLVEDFVIEGNISQSGDVDWFVLKGQEGTEAAFTIEHGDDVDFDFEVYNEEEQVGSATGSNSGDSITCQLPGRCFVKVWSARGSGAYDIRIQPHDSDNSDNSGNDTNSENDEREPNGTKDQADTIPRNKFNIRGMIARPTDVDWFELMGQEGNHPTFAIEHAADVNFDFEVFNDDNSVGKAVGHNSGDSIDCTVPGKCYVKVWSARGIGNYRINFGTRASQNDEQEPNDTREKADPIPSNKMEIRGEIASASDIDWFVLSGQEGNHPTFAIEHTPNVDFDFEVYSDENTAGSATAPNSGDSITCAVPGKCFIRVWSANGTGAYKINITREQEEHK